MYRDHGLAVFRNASGHEADRIRKEMAKIFQNLGLKITIQTNLKRVDFLDVTLDLTTGKYCPHRKPNDKPMCINCQSNHPPTIIKNLPASISRRLTDISQADRIRKEMAKIFQNLGLKITIQTNLKRVDFLDVALDLTRVKYCPHRKPNDKPMCINCQSNHPPTIIKNLPASIGRRLADISNDEDVFRDATAIYSDALRKSGYRENVQHLDKRKTDETKKRRKRIATGTSCGSIHHLARTSPPTSDIASSS